MNGNVKVVGFVLFFFLTVGESVSTSVVCRRKKKAYAEFQAKLNSA